MTINPTSRTRHLLTIGHSYVVALNRGLPRAIAAESSGGWKLTVLAPRAVRAALRTIELEDAAAEPFDLQRISLFVSKSPQLRFYGWQLRRAMQTPADLIFSWTEPYTVSGYQIASLAPRQVPFLFWTAQNLSKRYPFPFGWFERYCLRRADGWLACGQSIHNTMAARGYTSKPSRIAGLGIDPAHFCPDPGLRERIRAELGFSDARLPVIGYSGRFVPEKGIPMLLRVLERLSHPFNAVFLGNGPLLGELEAFAARFPGRVRICSSVKHAQMPAYMNALDVLAAPSQTTAVWKEQFGRMIVEAFACGVPVIASDSGEIPFVVGDAGVVAPEADEAAWGRALDRLLADESERARYRAAGLERVHACFTWNAIARIYIDFFEELLASPNRST